MRLKLADGSSERLAPASDHGRVRSHLHGGRPLLCLRPEPANLNLKLVIRDTKQNKDCIFDPGGGFAGMRRPSFAPDGSRVIFSIPANGGQQIHSRQQRGRRPSGADQEQLQ